MSKEVDKCECKECDEILKDTKWVKELKNSPIFNMSLGDKELFHSNFLAWAIKQYPKEARDFFCGVFKDVDCDKCECDCNCSENIISDIRREKKKIDLSFTLCGCCEIFIENKVKSIAYEEQLEKYTEAICGDNNCDCKKFILLSLKTPKFFNNQTTFKNWNLVKYKDLIEGFYKRIIPKDCYHKCLIDDYVNYLKILIDNVLCIFNSSENNKFCISRLHCKDQCENKILKKFQKIRLHDLLQKGLFEDFAYQLYSKCDTSSPPFPKPIIYGKDVQTPNRISIHSGYSNNQGFVDIRYTLQDGCSLGVQIQGNGYRQYVLAKNDKAQKFAECLFCNEQTRKWFDGLKIPKFNKKQEKNALKLCKESESFKKFKIKDGRLFIYRSRSLFEIGNNDCLIALIIEDMKKAIKIQNCNCNEESGN